MKVADLLESRRQNWRELEQACSELEGFRIRRSMPAAKMVRFTSLYRAACADLALADSYQLPQYTVSYLHHLVGRAHNQLYRSRPFDLQAWSWELFHGIPQRLFHDNFLRLAFVLFWGLFGISAYLGYADPQFAEALLGKEALNQYEENFSRPVSEGRNMGTDSFMAGFYIQHNGSIGLQCFAFGLILGIAGLFVTVFNAMQLGTVFGYMATTPSWPNFREFVTAHGPFELTAIVLAAGAGMKMGFALVDTGGKERFYALRTAAKEALPTMILALGLFGGAALLEGFLSPSAAPYWIKALAAVASTGLMLFYFVLLGYPRSTRRAA